jgi:hypothetical protein
MRKSKYTEVGGSGRFPVDLLAVFGIRVGGGGASPRGFRVANARTWLVGGGECLGEFGEEQDEAVMTRFLTPLRVSVMVGAAEWDMQVRRCVDRGAVLMRLMTDACSSISDDDIMSLVAGVRLED